MSLLLLFNNIKILLTKRSLSVQFIGSGTELLLSAGGDNQMQFIGSDTELDVL